MGSNVWNPEADGQADLGDGFQALDNSGKMNENAVEPD